MKDIKADLMITLRDRRQERYQLESYPPSWMPPGSSISRYRRCVIIRSFPFGGCRLCIVEVKGSAKPIASCTTFAKEGMEVTTASPYLEKLRKTTLELLLSDHPTDCMVCERAGDCKLQELAYFYGVREKRFVGERRIYTKKDNNPFIESDMEKCIMCGQCVRVCDEIEGVRAIDFAYTRFQDKDMRVL